VDCVFATLVTVLLSLCGLVAWNITPRLGHAAFNSWNYGRPFVFAVVESPEVSGATSDVWANEFAASPYLSKIGSNPYKHLAEFRPVAFASNLLIGGMLVVGTAWSLSQSFRSEIAKPRFSLRCLLIAMLAIALWFAIGSREIVGAWGGWPRFIYDHVVVFGHVSVALMCSLTIMATPAVVNGIAWGRKGVPRQ
jgi:hypothetical protein